MEVARAAPLAMTRPPLGRLLAGHWTGTLDYRDFKTDRRTVLPTNAEAMSETNGIALAFDFDDGPGKRVTATQRWRIESDQLRIESRDGTERFHLVEYRSSGPDELTLVFDGEGRENDAAVLVRTIVARRGNTLSITRMTRTNGTPFLMRHAYWLKSAP